MSTMSPGLMRLLVSGSRMHPDRQQVFQVLDQLWDQNSIEAIAHGGARGVDTWVSQWARKHQVVPQVYNAAWGRLGRSAGPIRNREMVEAFKPTMIVAFWAGRSAGTWDMISIAYEKDIPVLICRPKET